MFGVIHAIKEVQCRIEKTSTETSMKSKSNDIKDVMYTVDIRYSKYRKHSIKRNMAEDKGVKSVNY